MLSLPYALRKSNPNNAIRVQIKMEEMKSAVKNIITSFDYYRTASIIIGQLRLDYSNQFFK